MSITALPGDFREVLQRRLGELERQLLSKVAELEDEKSLLHNETSAHRQKTESALNSLLQRVTELERGERFTSVSVAPWLTSIRPPSPLSSFLAASSWLGSGAQSKGGQAGRGQQHSPLGH